MLGFTRMHGTSADGVRSGSRGTGIGKKMLAVTSLFVVGLLGMTACKNDVASDAHKAADIAACNNRMSLHSWYHAAMQNDVELEKIWSKRPDNIWAQTSGYWKGDSIKKYYGQKATPDVTAGGYVWHTITSGVVEIAADRQTAKGVWYTPGLGGKRVKDGKSNAGWMWEKYGVDFVRENGEWKIWHMKVYTDWSAPLGGSIDDPGGMGPAPSDDKKSKDAKAGGAKSPEKIGATESTIGAKEKDKKVAPAGGQGQPNWDYFYKTPYPAWAPGVSPQLIPKPPEPYKTFSETWSYADEGQ